MNSYVLNLKAKAKKKKKKTVNMQAKVFKQNRFAALMKDPRYKFCMMSFSVVQIQIIILGITITLLLASVISLLFLMWWIIR